MEMKHIVVGITGASGSILGKYTIQMLIDNGVFVTVIPTETGKSVFLYETEENLYDFMEKFDKTSYHIAESNNFFDSVASGSRAADGMIIIPCSMGTLGKIASGTSDNLLIRASDVMIKEQKKLILVVREAPYNFIHIDNMRKLCHPGVFIMPPVPLFYIKPDNIDAMYRQMVGRFLKTLGIDNKEFIPWDGSEA